jgi:uncharacterized membrane protein
MSSPSDRRAPFLRSRRALAALGLATAALLAACADEEAPGGEPPPDPDSELCQKSTLTYQNFAAPFAISWCRGCHGKGQPLDMRQDAPVGVNFDTAEELRAAGPRLLARVTGAAPTMPPAGGPSAEERALLAEWVSCGMK